MAEMWINMGPQHPMTHGLWNLRIKVDGETIVDAEPEIGYLHRGYEKIMEVREFQKNVVLTDRLCYVSSITWSHCYCLACEAAMDLDVPERGKYLRVVSNELQRIASHLMWLAAYGPDLGLLTALLWALRERELFLDLLQLITGARMNQNYPRIGGVRNDAPGDFEKYCAKVIGHFRKKLGEHEKVFEQSKLFQVRIDLRKLDPYDAYPEMDFQPAVEQEGDSYARYKVRVEEMKTSCDIILQALHKMPTGPYRVKPPRRIEGEGFRRTEDSRGEALFYVIGDGDDRPYRVKIRSPVFSNIAAAPLMMRGNKVADVVAIMGSIDVCVGEMDK
ncbi:MAG: NADH-quinone oxidoreductase subunit D [Methanobacteriota archaeon]|nr:MAG: NADH-quinone oxidoreductase subunit D [Euryarchaeota archaeon]